MKHCIKQKRMGEGLGTQKRNMDKQITSMITVTGEYCAFFPEELSQLESDQTSAEGGIPPLSLNVVLSLSQRASQCE